MKRTKTAVLLYYGLESDFSKTKPDELTHRFRSVNTRIAAK